VVWALPSSVLRPVRAPPCLELIRPTLWLLYIWQLDIGGVEQLPQFLLQTRPDRVPLGLAATIDALWVRAAAALEYLYAPGLDVGSPVALVWQERGILLMLFRLVAAESSLALFKSARRYHAAGKVGH